MAKDWEAEYNRMAKEARKLAKRANQRMLRLERYAEERALYSEILDFSYAEAQKKIRALYGKEGEKLRFTENQKLLTINDGTKNIEGPMRYRKNVESLKQKIAAMEKFLGSASSTIADIKKDGEVIKPGMKTVLDKRTNTINTADKFKLQKYGLSLTSDELKRFFESKQQEKLQSNVGSNSMFIVAAVIKQENIPYQKKDLLEYLRNNINLKSSGLSEADFDESKYKTRKDVTNKLLQYAKFTGNDVLDKYIRDSIKSGMSAKNLFI